MSLLPPSRIFVSPHPDDVAYSCFASLATPSADLTRTLIVTVFGSSVRAHGVLGLRGSNQEISTIRLQEDASFAIAMRCNLQSLDFEDSSLRFKEWIPFESLDPRRDPIFPRVKERLARIIKPLLGRAAIFVPLGIGFHIDHCIVRDAVTDIMSDYERSCNQADLFYFEDLPYAANFSNEEIERYARMIISNAAKPLCVSLEDLWSKKRRAIEMYDSQLKPTVLPAIRQHAWRIGCHNHKAERLWIKTADASVVPLKALLVSELRQLDQITTTSNRVKDESY